MSRLALVLDQAPTPLNWTPPPGCPLCRPDQTCDHCLPAPIEAVHHDGELAGYRCAASSACTWQVQLCRYCGWPAGPACTTCRLHFRPLTDFQAVSIGEARRHQPPDMPPA